MDLGSILEAHANSKWEYDKGSTIAWGLSQKGVLCIEAGDSQYNFPKPDPADTLEFKPSLTIN